MLGSNRRFRILVLTYLVILPLLASCGRTPATQIPESTPTPVIISQWAIAASSNIEPNAAVGSNAERAIGEKTQIISCDIAVSDLYAWTSAGSSSWLEVYFEKPVYPTELIISHILKPNQVTRIELIDMHSGYHEVYTGGQRNEECPYQQIVDVSSTELAVIGARLWVDDSAYGKSSIDAVQLLGEPSGDENTYGTPTPLPGTSTPVPAALGERSFVDRPDDFPNQYQIHVVYLLFKDQQDLERDTDGSIAASLNLANSWFTEQTGGPSLRFDTYQGELDVTFKQFNITKSVFLENVRKLYERDRPLYPGLVLEDYYLYWMGQKAEDLELNAPGKYYIVYAELAHSIACGQSYLSNHLGVFFLQTQRCGYGRLGVDKHPWVTEFVVIHEFLHGIGFVQACGPHAKDYHVTDSNKDLMYPYAGSGEVNLLDVGNDDYYNHEIPNCPDLADSAFLEPLPANPKPPIDWPDPYLLKK